MRFLFIFLALAGLIAFFFYKSSKPSQGSKSLVSSIIKGGNKLAAVKPDKLDGSGTFSFAEVDGLDLYLLFYAPWTDSGKDINTVIQGMERAGKWVLPVAVGNRTGENPTSADGSPSGRLPAVWSVPELAGLAGELRALPTTLLLNSKGEVIQKWEGHHNPDQLLAVQSGDK